MNLAMFKLSPKQIDSKLIELYRVVDIHNQTIELIDFAVSTAGIHYIMASLLVVISLAINLHRLVNATLIKKNQLEMLFCFTLVAIHLLIIFLNNYNGQKLMNSSQKLFDELYNSMWYSMPLKAQKILLLIMLQSTTTHAFNILGLFTPCHTGFSTNSEISLFETNIRFMGSLLACYALTGDVMFRDKAAQLGERMLPAFQTETGIPHSLINLHTGASKNYGDITGNPVFKSKVENVRKVLKNLEKPKGLYPNYIHPKTGKWGQHHMSLGGLGDSFYEYLLKAWIQSGKEDVEARQMYDEAIVAIDQHMIKTSQGKLLYVSDLKYDRLEHKMGHLACFAGGMFALGAKTLQNELSDRYMTIAAGLTNTCHESYDRSYTKLGPEAFHFIEGNEAKSLKNGEKYYILRPENEKRNSRSIFARNTIETSNSETFESYFVMWRLTKDPKYREWGWEAVQALEKYCRVPGGFTGLHNVYLVDPPQDDVQQSYFFAETLKYLYLLFSDDDLINLDEWVFNSEAHVLPIRGNPLYRPAPSL
ncbi:Mannosyl-oligosaccharide alpha-1,2-mannosidase isoform B [Apis cerana cerana]|uniref:alpha-1,2-Mannosidase n=1 Tax=Apis cerana cerana TaxID=94128 RepID=A0A2A3E1K7_APICC|nr:Mannosyl-oligosaccharide alpha-1,2-mannosidase isoform B [Apis cerana cerana]